MRWRENNLVWFIKTPGGTVYSSTNTFQKFVSQGSVYSVHERDYYSKTSMCQFSMDFPV